MLEELKNLKLNLSRYDIYVCNCIIGPHLETELNSEGQYVTFEELEDEIDKLIIRLENKNV